MDTTLWTTSRPLDFAASIARYNRWGSDPVNVVRDGAYHRITTEGCRYRAAQIGPTQVELLVFEGDPDDALADIGHRLADHLPGPGQSGGVHPAVAVQVKRMPGYRPPLVRDPFEAVITSITAQQVNLTWATTTRQRLVERFGARHDLGGVDVWSFPSRDALAQATIVELRDLQFTTSKSEFIICVAQAAAAGHLDGLDLLTNQDVISHVMQLRGVGRWTADWLLARCLGRGDAVAAGDLGVRKAVSRWVLEVDEVAPEVEIRAAVASWGAGANWSTHLLLEKLAES